jgi:hypothetical protein
VQPSALAPRTWKALTSRSVLPLPTGITVAPMRCQASNTAPATNGPLL